MNFQDILKLREEYHTIKARVQAKVKDLELQESKILAGKESIFSKLKKVSKEEQLAANKTTL